MIQRLALTLGLYLAFACTSPAALLITTNSTWKLFKGRSEASSPISAWRAIAFDDGAWTASPAPFSYGEGYTTGTMLDDMRGQYTCIFLRHTFVTTNIPDIAALRLSALSDDGFIAWINGTEVARFNMPAGEVPYNGVSSPAMTEPIPYETYTLLNPSAYLVSGANVLAIQGFNASLNDSSDFVFEASLSSVPNDSVAPTITNVVPAAGTVNELTSITVQFSEPVIGVDASDLLIDGFALAAMSGSGNTYTFNFDQPAYGTVSISWSTNHGIFDEAISPNRFDSTAPGATWQYELVDETPPTVRSVFPAPGTTTRMLTQIEVTFSEDVAGVDAQDLLINGQPAVTMNKVPGGPYVFQFPEPPAGTVNISWASGHGITDLAVTPNAFAGAPWGYELNPSAVSADLVITEILAANVAGLKDEDGDEEDWIEIWNRGSNAVDLAGWALSDDPDVPGLWQFGSRLLSAGQYIVVFASGKDRKNPAVTNRFHTNFRLGTDGEHLGLYSPDSPRVLVSGFASYPEQRNDHSYGYDADGNLRYFRTPTPGAPNAASSITGVVAPVHFNVERGHFSAPFDLYLSTDTPKATIRMTFNGSEPTELNGVPYTNAVRVAANAFIRAAAFRTNMLPSRTETHTYLFNQSALIRSLPIISLLTATNNLIGRTGIIGMDSSPDAIPCNTPFSPGWSNSPTDYHNPTKHGIAWERPVSAEFLRLDGQRGFQIDCGIRVQGSDYQRPRTCPTSKFSYRLYFRSDYGEGRLDYPLFTNTTVASFDQLVLRAGFNDNSNPFIRDELTRRLWGDMAHVGSHGNFVNLFVNGEYKGYYNPCERIHEEMLQSYHGGAEEWDVIAPSFAVSSEGRGVVDGDRTAFNAMENFIRTSQVTNPVVYQQVTQQLDLVNFVDYCLLNVYCGMGDWPANNWRAGKDRTGGIWRFYIWDGEWAMGIYGRVVTRDTFAESGPGPDNSGLASIGNSEIARIYQSLRRNPEFLLLWADRIHKHMFNGGPLMDQNILAHFNSMRTELTGVIPSMNTDIPGTWVPQRRAIIMQHFQNYGLLASSNAPIFSRHGGRVARNFRLTMTASNLTDSVIYYTTNGTDPRVMFSGAISPEAIAYDPAVEFRLQHSTIVKARTLRNGTNWSALTEASFEVGIIGAPIRITEINYNPPGGNGFEFIELRNLGAVPVDLTGMFFEGITFIFPAVTILNPGASLVLSSDLDPNGFAARYPGVIVAGRFTGNLANGGERITLKDRTGVIVVSVDYDDERGWPTAADGQGSSLEINDPFGNPDDPANWRASAQLYGTPGQATSAPPLAAVRINELMATNRAAVPNMGTYPDWVELHNAGASAANIAGWSLTDDGNPRKFVFPAGTTIPAGGYLVVWCDAVTNTTPGFHTGFALDRDGETVLLYNSVTSRVDGVTYGLQITDYSMGRIGGEWQLTLPTPNAMNMAAPLGTNFPAINEWQANPFPGQPDWVELHNTNSLPVSLHGMYLGITGMVQQITSPSYVPPRGFAQIFMDENVGPNHLDARLPATGGTIVLYDSAAVELTRVAYGAPPEGASQGRLPNGTGPVMTFTASVSPGASNYVVVYNGPYINEVMARNRSAITNSMGDVSDWIELYNPAATNVDMSGMSLSMNRPEPGEWVFPAGSIVPPGSYVVIWCEDNRPATTAAGAYLNTGQNLDGESGGVYLFNTSRQLINSIEYGFQIADQSIGRIGTQWRLLSNATPGATNSTAAALGGATNLVFNEWMAQSASGPDWFELFNAGTLPVDISGLFVTDDPSTTGAMRSRIAPLSFIAGGGWVRFIADEEPNAGRDHVTFSLAGDGESLRLYSGTTLLTGIYFGKQSPGVSEGRMPDGGANFVRFPSSPSPGESNYLPPQNVVFNEVLSHTAPPLEDAIELHNPSSQPAEIGGWYLSDSPDFKKFRIPDGTILPAGGHIVFYENQFNDGSATAFSLSRSRGNELWLSEADEAGSLSGVRATVRFGPALSGVSMGRFDTHLGPKFVALTARTFGADNAPAQVGPIVISEIMYHPPDIVTETNIINNTDDEFVELHNISSSAVDLSNWRLVNAVNYTFTPGVSLPAGGYLLVVSFSPVTNAAALDAFRATYGLSASVPIFGPYAGRLDNDAETVELQQPDIPDGPLVPYVVVETVDYTDTAPWPAAATDGGGLSMSRLAIPEGGGPSTPGFANEPVSWVAADPTPGAANGGPTVPLPVITQSPTTQTNVIGTTRSLSVSATGSGPLFYQWRFNGVNIRGATNDTLLFSPVELEHAGVYDVFVSNPGGSTFSDPATITIAAPPTITVGPQEFVVRPGTNVLFSVTATGPGPLTYQWTSNGVDIAGATSRTLSLTNVQLEHAAEYAVRVTNPYATVSAAGALIVLVAPVYTEHPQSVTALEGEDVSFHVSATGTRPMGIRWRRNAFPYASFDVATFTLVVTNVQVTTTVVYFDAVITNRASLGGVLSARAFLTVQADFDGDGAGDAWEIQHGFQTNSMSMDGLLDTDGDGLTNAQEFRAGTNPNDPASVLRIESVIYSPLATHVTFLAVSNRSFSVQFNDAPSTPPGSGWSTLGHVFIQPTNRVETLIDSNALPQRYYRLVTPYQW